MGCGQSIDADQAHQNKQSAAIDAELRRARQEEAKTVKCLMLGAGESGKSTLVKQMRLMYANPYSDRERHDYKEIVFTNALQSMQAVIRGFEVCNVALPQQHIPTAEYLLLVHSEDATDPSTGDIEPGVRNAIIALWAEPATKEVVARSSQFQLNDSAQYFFDAMPRLGEPRYVPTDQDILRTRVRSTGIVEEVFAVKAHRLRVFDVGGQRSERKKWIHCFENVSVLVFVAAISEYDQVLFEDSTVNRLAEATMLWESIAGSRWFTQSAFVLMLNKVDLFTNKILGAGPPLGAYFPDYTGPPRDLEAAKNYMRAKFIALNPRKDRGLYVHLTCATDTNQARVVLAAVMDQVLTRLLSEVGLL
ncbi:guanine nucleotide-binding protein subunit alpha [Rhodotorula paludigena]|uniref:guanine nucleotide-binding protein subunit alpha n=1 Tax=Rhodotorula paludigena TaxID=86838 RepID=UPI00317733D8